MRNPSRKKRHQKRLSKVNRPTQSFEYGSSVAILESEPGPDAGDYSEAERFGKHGEPVNINERLL